MSICISLFLPYGNSVPKTCCGAWRGYLFKTRMVLSDLLPTPALMRPGIAVAFLSSTAPRAGVFMQQFSELEVHITGTGSPLPAPAPPSPPCPPIIPGSQMQVSHLCPLTWSPTTSLRVALCLATSLTGKAQGHLHPFRCYCEST